MQRFSKHHLFYHRRIAAIATLPVVLGCGARSSLTALDEIGTAPDACAGVTCTSPPSACFAPTGTCTGGVCSYAYADGVACDDGNRCTTGDTCRAGICAGRPACAIAAAGGSTCALTAASAVKCWGGNNRGQLGNGSTMGSDVPVDVVGLSTGVIAISAQYASACALTTLGAVRCWGDNAYGELGDGTTAPYSDVPVDVVGLSSGVIAISVGVAHACAVTASGTVKCWGNNTYGQLGDGTTVNSNVPVDVVDLPSKVTTLSAGSGATCALTAAGAVKCWGVLSSSKGPVDVAGLTSGAIAVSTGTGFVCGAITAGAVKCLGNDMYGQLGQGSTADSTVPGDVVGLSGVIAISAGYAHACALTSAGAVKCWGYNAHGQLGHDSTEDHSDVPVDVVGLSSGVIAVSAGSSHTCAISATGGVKCWGMNTYGQLGNGTTTKQSQLPVDVVGF